MNLLECTVAEVLSAPSEEYGKWWVKVIYTCYSSALLETQLMFDTKEGAEKIKQGCVFMA